MSPIAICSAVAIVVGLGGIVPQLVCMLRARSAAGQSALGWTLGTLVHLLMVYVNLVGNHATMLAVGSVLSATLCATALVLVLRLGPGAPAPAAQPEAPTAVPLDDLPTQELALLRAHVVVEHERRRARRRGAPALA